MLHANDIQIASSNKNLEYLLKVVLMSKDKGSRTLLVLFVFVGLAYQGKNMVLRLIIEYSSLRDFGPYFYMRIFERWYFGLCWNLRLVIEL